MQETGSDDGRVVPIARRVCSGLEWCLTQNNGQNVAVKTLLIDVNPYIISTPIMSAPVPSVKTAEENDQGWQKGCIPRNLSQFEHEECGTNGNMTNLIQC